MSSTEYSVGHDGKKSSRVLKPPGGGSSDIFGLGNPQSTQSSGNQSVQSKPATTKDRLFGSASPTQDVPSTPQRASSNVIVNQTPSSVSRKQYVRRNPITGEGIETVDKKVGNPEKENEGNPEEKEVEKKEEEDKPDVPRVIQTSIRVRNPPGGKSSGIF